MVFKRCYWFPIAFCLLMPVTFIITYATAVVNENVTPVFPYISDTGTWPPESCIFALCLSFGALLLGIIVYIRHRQVKELCEKNEFKPSITKLDKLALFLGCNVVIGIIVVACFQVTNVFSVHVLGAGMTFGLGSIYHIVQLLISFSMYPAFGNIYVNRVRLIFTLLYLVALLLSMIFSVLSLLKFTGDDITKWTEKDGGYKLHLVGTISEWVMVGFNQLLVLLFTWEFRQIQFSEPMIITIT